MNDWIKLLADLAEAARLEIINALTFWTPIQALIIAGAFVAARYASPRLSPHLKKIPQWAGKHPFLQRFIGVLIGRLDWILMALLLWGAVFVMRRVAWPSHSYIIYNAALLATAWVIISWMSRIFHNRSIGQFFAIIAWSLLALNFLGIDDEMALLLEKTALTVGTTRISMLLVLKAVIMLVAFLWAASTLSNFVERRLRSTLDVSATAHVLISKAVKTAAIVLAVVSALSLVGIDLTAMAVFSGALGLGIGIGLQKLASNLMSGVIILLDRSIKPGDVITVGDTFGAISSLNARYVNVVARNGVSYLVPNETFITEPVINWSYSQRLVRIDVHFGVSYDSDPHEVRRIAVETVTSVARVRRAKDPVCHITAFGDSAIEFILRFWIEDPEDGVTNVRGNVLLALWDAFKAAGITIPYPHREIIIKPQATPPGSGEAVQLSLLSKGPDAGAD
ncbi:MAG: mechanosensitive ion channel [Hyphomicrobiaceae bacterium]|nr:mechanosensitive ion channel [Hyphomicrobiaceae bacterium]